MQVKNGREYFDPRTHFGDTSLSQPLPGAVNPGALDPHEELTMPATLPRVGTEAMELLKGIAENIRLIEVNTRLSSAHTIDLVKLVGGQQENSAGEVEPPELGDVVR